MHTQMARAHPPVPWYVTLMLVHGLAIAAFSAVRPMVSYRALELGADPFELGLIASAFSVLALLTAIPAGRWIDSQGEGWFIVAGSLGLAAASFAMVTSDSLLVLAAEHAVLGFSHMLLVIAAQTLIANRSSAVERQARYSTYAALSSVGQTIGPAIGGMLAGSAVAGGEANAEQVFALAPIPLLLSAMLAVRLVRVARRCSTVSRRGTSTDSASDHAIRSADILRLPGMPRALGASIVGVLSLDLLTTYLPAFGIASGFSAAEVGYLLAIRAAFSLVSRLSLMMLIRAVGQTVVFVVSLVIAAMGFSVLPFIEALGPGLVAMAIVGIGLGIGQPMTIAMVANVAPVDRLGAAMGVRVTGNRLAQLTIPWSIGLIATGAGISAVFLFVTIALVGTAITFARPARERRARSAPVGPWVQTESASGPASEHDEN